MGKKMGKQAGKDYIIYPALAGTSWKHTLKANAIANLIRNYWTYMVIFCGHFPDGAEKFTRESFENETRGEWYLRQMLGSANLTGSKLFHIMSGNLSHQIEHHIFPDIPAHRYSDLAVEVREICQRYGLRYNAGPLSKQFGSVVRKITRLAFPGGGRRKAETVAAPVVTPTAIAVKNGTLATRP